MSEMLPFHGTKSAPKNLREPTHCQTNDGRARQRHTSTQTADTGDTLPSSRKTNTEGVPTNTRGLDQFTVASLQYNTTITQTSLTMNLDRQYSSSNLQGN
ncbi:hypothetical protein PoB_005939000 [Plakobranchus ocellatus]|uniref:Uncharacterized protein n=1 Tax=Plakobranchus ocellatus TaxID=259542 RepID=A0AAV4CLL2_9GAST|nr:hypothetical protein PoB_005939000 [Plakobranchus ocellatus]